MTHCRRGMPELRDFTFRPVAEEDLPTEWKSFAKVNADFYKK